MDRGVLLEVEVEKKLPGDGHDDAEYKFQRRSHLRSRRYGPSASHGAALLLFGFFDPQSGRVNKLDDHPEEIPALRRGAEMSAIENHISRSGEACTV